MLTTIIGILFGGLLLGAMGGGGSGRSTTSPTTTDDDADTGPTPLPTPDSDRPDIGDDAYTLSWTGLKPEEQLIVELINRARLDPRDEATRLADDLATGSPTAPVAPLAVVQTLSDAARAHSEDMDNREFIEHTNPDGETPADRAVAEGHGNRYVGENIGYQASTRAPNLQDRAETHHESLWSSDGHQRNLLSENWSEVGLGYDYGNHTSDTGTTYDHATFVTEKFGNTGETYLTGVVIDDADGDRFYDLGEGVGGVRVTAYNDDGAFGTATWDAGGYTLALPPGTYTVAFEGDTLDAIYETEITITDENVKLDLIEESSGTSKLTLNAVPEPSDGSDLIAAISLDTVETLDETVLADVEEEFTELVI